MAVDDYRQNYLDNSDRLQEGQRRRFGFQSGLGTQAPIGSLPDRQAQAPDMAPPPLSGATRSTAGPGYTHYNGGQGSTPAGSIRSAINAYKNARRGGAPATGAASSRAMRRGGGGTTTGDSFSMSTRNVNINMGDENIGNFSTGDILGSGAMQDKSTNIDASTRNLSIGPTATQTAKGGNATATAGGVGPTAPKRPRTGGRVKGELSTNPRAIQRREQTKARKASGATTTATARGGNASNMSEQGGTYNVGNIDMSSRVGGSMFGTGGVHSAPTTGGPVNVGSGNRTIVQKGKTNTGTISGDTTTIDKRPPASGPATPTPTGGTPSPATPATATKPSRARGKGVKPATGGPAPAATPAAPAGGGATPATPAPAPATPAPAPSRARGSAVKKEEKPAAKEKPAPKEKPKETPAPEKKADSPKAKGGKQPPKSPK